MARPRSWLLLRRADYFHCDVWQGLLCILGQAGRIYLSVATGQVSQGRVAKITTALNDPPLRDSRITG